MAGAFKHFKKLLRARSSDDELLVAAIKNIVGRRPKNLSLYQLATRHTSVAKTNEHGLRESNERLEYLGDAVLGAVVAEFLFKKYPFKEEGFLTEIRSRLVSRESLNVLGRKIGISDIVKVDRRRKEKTSHKSLYGDTLEALIGAVYLDRGFKAAKDFIIEKLIIPYFDLEEVVKSERNFKSKIIEWAQRNDKDLRFEVVKIIDEKSHKEFTAQLFVDDKPVAKGHGLNKKKAEQSAAEKSCQILNITSV